MKSPHTFHIPVMGTAFSIDTPLKTAKYGISSVISLVDDCLIEDMRQYYCQQYNEPYTPITKEEDDFRAKRITAYLDLVDKIVQRQIEEIKAAPFEPGSEITKYFEMLPDASPLSRLYRIMLSTNDTETRRRLQDELRQQIVPGDINVNIMTKVDRVNYSKNKTELPPEYSDALSALRGFAKSRLSAGVVLSAGFNRRLYSYIENFKDFYADATGFIKKRIILKVTDFRSSLTQGKFFAKKGLWVSEYRVESGLNCGGHAFASDGYLMGPILEEFKNKRQELVQSLHKIYNQALQLKNKFTFAKPHAFKVTAQGGIGTADEDRFLLEYYALNGTGWGSPFLLVPEVTNVDPETLDKLSKAGEQDLYLSDVSPLGVPFNNLKGSLSDRERDTKKEKGRPGSSCPKGYLVSNTEFTKKPICTASRLYQKLKIDQLKTLNLPASQYEKLLNSVTLKSCICNDLGEAVYIKNNIQKKIKNLFPAVCPGPNIAYFSKIATLKEMTDHIYGRINLLNPMYRPHMFMKELKLYIDYFKTEISKTIEQNEIKRINYLKVFRDNLMDGIAYYRELFSQKMNVSEDRKKELLSELSSLSQFFQDILNRYRNMFDQPIREDENLTALCSTV